MQPEADFTGWVDIGTDGNRDGPISLLDPLTVSFDGRFYPVHTQG